MSSFCPKCNSSAAAGSPFCPDCGEKMLQPAAKPNDGIHLSEKSTVVGDVTGGDRIDIKTHGGQAHFHTHKDPTKNVATCSNCGDKRLELEGFTCRSCGKWSCEECYDRNSRLCELCIKYEKSDKRREFQALLEQVYEDGRVDADEAIAMKNMAMRLGLSDEEVADLRKAYDPNGQNDNQLSRLEQLDLKKAEQLLLHDFDVQNALAKLSPLYEKHGHANNIVRRNYLLALLENDLEQALRVASSFPFDDPDVILVHVEALCRTGKYHEAEEIRKRAAGLFPEDVRLKAVEAEMMLDGYFKSKDEAYVDAAREILEQCEGGDDDLYVFFVRTYLYQFEEENALAKGRESLIDSGHNTFYFDRKLPNKESRFSEAIIEWEKASASNTVLEWFQEKLGAPNLIDEWHKGAKMSDRDAQFLLGEYLYQKAEEEGGDLNEAVGCWQKSASQGQKYAQFFLAWSYRTGSGIQADHAEAFNWFRKAADQGHPEAQYWLACCYRDGCGIREDYANAREWFKQAIEGGHNSATNALRDLGHN
jgi:TPR repeat protein